MRFEQLPKFDMFFWAVFLTVFWKVLYQYCFFTIFMSKELLDDTIVFRVKTSSWQASWGSYQLSQKHPILRKFRKFLLKNHAFFWGIFMSSKEVLDSTSIFSVIFKWVWSTTKKKWESPWEWFLFNENYELFFPKNSEENGPKRYIKVWKSFK